MEELPIVGADQMFRCKGSTAEGTLIFFDETGYVYLPPRSWQSLRADLAGQTVDLDRLRSWLRDNVGFKRDVAGHVAAVLLAEGIAQATAAGALEFPPVD